VTVFCNRDDGVTDSNTMSSALSRGRDCGRGNDALQLGTHDCARPECGGVRARTIAAAAAAAARAAARWSLPRQSGGSACLVSAGGGGRVTIYMYFFRFVFVVFFSTHRPRRRRTTEADGCRTPRPRRRRRGVPFSLAPPTTIARLSQARP